MEEGGELNMLKKLYALGTKVPKTENNTITPDGTENLEPDKLLRFHLLTDF